MPHMEVIGQDVLGQDILGEVDDEEIDGEYDEPEVDGYAGPMGDFGGTAIVGYDDYGEPVVVGARRRRRRPVRRSRAHRVRVVKPRWRTSQLAPGVIAPDQGMLPLPLSAENGNTFDLTHQTLTFQGTVQKPFRGERLLVTTVRTGTSATGRLLAQLFVGTDLQQLDVSRFDLEQVGDPNAFGVRLTMKPVQPGVFIRIDTTLSNAITTTDTIFAAVTLLGRYIG